MRAGQTGRPLLRLIRILILLLSLFLPGCWNQREPQDQAIILALGVDYDEEGDVYEVLVEIAIPTALAGAESGSGGGGGGQPASQLLSARGRTIFEALRNLEPLSPRELYWGHSELVVFSEALARRGLAPILDFFERERHSRLISKPLVAQNPLQKLMAVQLPLEDISGQGFVSQIMTQELNSAMVPVVDLRQVVMILSQPGIEVFVPKIRLVEGRAAGGSEAGGEGAAGGGESGNGEGAKPPAQVVEIKGGAAFTDDRLAGWLGVDAARGWLWITGHVKRATEIILCPDCDGAISVEIIHYSSRIKPLLEGGKPKIIVHINVDSRIQDLNCKHPFTAEREEIIPILNRRTAEAIRRKMAIAVAEAQALRADIFGFGREYFRRHPHRWREMEADWPLIFQNLEVELQVEADLRRVGLISDPIQLR